MKGEFTQKGKEALERFKMEAASEVGVNLKQFLRNSGSP